MFLLHAIYRRCFFYDETVSYTKRITIIVYVNVDSSHNESSTVYTA